MGRTHVMLEEASKYSSQIYTNLQEQIRLGHRIANIYMGSQCGINIIYLALLT